jgi:threonine aldolase
MKTYDLRSDTITLPSRDMRKAMYRADVGDDVYGEDPTVNALQDLACSITGKRDALFVPSGSMANLIAIYLGCGRGNEIITQKNSHIVHYELGSAAAIAGATIVPVPAERGILTPEIIFPYLRHDPSHNAKTSLIEVENTHNREGGTCYKVYELKNIYDFAKKYHLSVHMDGARIFNASVATGVPVKRMAAYADTVSFCLSKGLGAPVGSLICGTTQFIAEARRIRKMLGGGMRQAGILAAAGIFALQNNIERLAIDHQNAKTLARELDQTTWAEIDPQAVETNIVCFRTPTTAAQTVVNTLKKRGVLCTAMDTNLVRLVTHLNISQEDIEGVCAIIRDLRN